jgi:Family of unknown function (DUF5906)
MVQIRPGEKFTERYIIDEGMAKLLSHVMDIESVHLKEDDRMKLHELASSMGSFSSQVYERGVHMQRAAACPAVGRIYMRERGSLQSLRKLWRKEFLGKDCYEIDMVSCHATLMANMAALFPELEREELNSYVSQRNVWISMIQEFYRKSDDSVPDEAECKQFLTSICYGSGATCQLEDLKFVKMKQGDNFATVTNAAEIRLLEPRRIRFLKREVRDLTTALANAPADFTFGTVVNSFIRQHVGPDGDGIDVKRLSYFLQETELKCLKILHEECCAAKMDVRVLLHDGLVVCTTDVDMFELVQERASDAIQRKLQISIRFAIKPQCLSASESLMISELKDVAGKMGSVSVLKNPSVMASVSMCIAYANRDVYSENLLVMENALIETLRAETLKILSTPLEMPETFSLFREKHNVIETFILLFFQVWSEFQSCEADLHVFVMSECKAAIESLSGFVTSYEISDDSIGNMIKQLKFLICNEQDQHDTEEDTPKKRRKFVSGVPALKTISERLVKLMALARTFGYRPPRPFVVSVPDLSMIDYNIDFPSPRGKKYPHRPIMGRLFYLSGLVRIIYKYFRMCTDGRIIEVRNKAVHVFTFDPSLPVKIVTETSTIGAQPIPQHVVRMFASLLCPILEDCTHAKTQATQLSFLDFCDFRGDALVHRVGPFANCDDPNVLNTAKFPLYCHVLGKRLPETLTHEVDTYVRIILDRLFCHLAGCRACHCCLCITDMDKRCHFCDKRDDRSEICGHFAYRQSTELCNKLKTWYMFLLMYPHEPIKIAILLYSKTGGQGKSTLMSKLPTLLLGDDLCCTDKSSSFLVKQFNQLVEGKRILAVSEADFHFNVTLNQTLLSIIDIETLVIEPKFQEARQSQFYAGIMLASNSLRTFPTVKQDSRKMMGFVSNSKDKIPMFESEVLEPIHTAWCNVTGDAKTKLIMDIISYFAQMDMEKKIRHFPDVRVQDFPLLKALSKYTDDFRRVMEFETEFLQPLIHAIATGDVATPCRVQMSGYGEPKLPKEILSLCTTFDDVRDTFCSIDNSSASLTTVDRRSVQQGMPLYVPFKSSPNEDRPFHIGFRAANKNMMKSGSVWCLGVFGADSVAKWSDVVKKRDSSIGTWHNLSSA